MLPCDVNISLQIFKIYDNLPKKKSFILEDYYPNGSIQLRCCFKNGMLHGLYQHWHSNGKICGERTYKDGALHGVWKYWYMSGQLKEECTFHEGVVIGIYREFYPIGSIEEEINLTNSIYRSYTTEGKLEQEIPLTDDRLDLLYRSCNRLIPFYSSRTLKENKTDTP